MQLLMGSPLTSTSPHREGASRPMAGDSNRRSWMKTSASCANKLRRWVSDALPSLASRSVIPVQLGRAEDYARGRHQFSRRRARSRERIPTATSLTTAEILAAVSGAPDPTLSPPSVRAGHPRPPLLRPNPFQGREHPATPYHSGSGEGGQNAAAAGIQCLARA